MLQRRSSPNALICDRPPSERASEQNGRNHGLHLRRGNFCNRLVDKLGSYVTALMRNQIGLDACVSCTRAHSLLSNRPQAWSANIVQQMELFHHVYGFSFCTVSCLICTQQPYSNIEDKLLVASLQILPARQAGRPPALISDCSQPASFAWWWLDCLPTPPSLPKHPCCCCPRAL